VGEGRARSPTIGISLCIAGYELVVAAALRDAPLDSRAPANIEGDIEVAHPSPATRPTQLATCPAGARVGSVAGKFQDRAAIVPAAGQSIRPMDHRVPFHGSGIDVRPQHKGTCNYNSSTNGSYARSLRTAAQPAGEQRDPKDGRSDQHSEEEQVAERHPGAEDKCVHDVRR